MDNKVVIQSTNLPLRQGLCTESDFHSKKIENWADSVWLQSINVGSGCDEAICEQSECMMKSGVAVNDDGAWATSIENTVSDGVACIHFFRQSPKMQTHHHHIGEINPVPCAWTKQRQVEVLDNRALSENRLRERLRTIFSRYVSCYANLKLTILWPFVTSKNENIKLASTCRSVHSLQPP